MAHVAIQRHVPPDFVYQTPRSTGRMDPFARFGGGVDGSFAPAFEVREKKDCFELEADVPGVKSSDLHIFIHGNLVTIRGERSQRPAGDDMVYRTYERTYGVFWRAFRLFPGINCVGARADLTNGVLTLILPKANDKPFH